MDVIALATGVFFSAALLIGGTVAAGATTAGAKAMQTCSSSRTVRPSRYVLGCGSGTYVLTNITWRTWKSAGATGSTTYVVNSCTPNCAAENNISYRATVVVSGAKSTKNGPVFTLLSLHYLKNGVAKTTTWKLPPFG